MKYFIKTAKKKKDPGVVSKAIDYSSTAALGALGGMAGTTAYHIGSAKLADPYYSPSLSDVGKKQFHGAIAGKTKFFKSLVRTGAAGAVLGAGAAAAIKYKRNKEGKSTAFSTPSKIVGAIGTAALGVGAYKHRGKLYLMRKGHLDKFDPWRGQIGIKQFFKGEQWVPAKAYDDIAKAKTVDTPAQTYNLQREFPKSKDLVAPPKAARTGSKDLDSFYRDFEKTHKPPILGGDPEFNVTLRMGKKKLPLEVAGFAEQPSVGGSIRDFSVAGAEFSNVKPGTADAFTKAIKKKTDVFEASVKDPKIKVESLGAHPTRKSSKNQYITSRKTAGGHLHASFPKVEGEDLTKTRIRMQKRVALLHAPIDYTNPVGPARFGLEAGGGTYGKKQISERAAREITSWAPKKGFGNMEVRLGPTYIKDQNALNKKLKLLNIAINHPKAAKLDAIADKVWGVTGNKSRGMYNPEVRKYVSSELRNFYKKDLGIEDKWLNKTLRQYEQGQIRTLGK